jgi:hypothetical protein
VKLFRRPVMAVAAAAVLLGLAGCDLVGIGQPGGRMEPAIEGPAELQPIGPVVELGHGEAFGIAWRYSVHESRMGWCTTLDLEGGSGGSGCGGELGVQANGGPIALSGMSSGTGSPTVLEGFAADEVRAVVVETRDGGRFPATLMSLAPVNVGGQVFIVLVPGDRTPQRLVALDAAGGELGSQAVDAP